MGSKEAPAAAAAANLDQNFSRDELLISQSLELFGQLHSDLT